MKRILVISKTNLFMNEKISKVMIGPYDITSFIVVQLLNHVHLPPCNPMDYSTQVFFTISPKFALVL